MTTLALAGAVGSKVSDLRRLVAQDTTQLTHTDYRSVEVSEEDADLVVRAGDHTFSLDDQSLQLFGKPLGITGKFLTDTLTDNAVRRTVLQHLVDNHAADKVVFEHDSGRLLATYESGPRIIPRNRYVDVVTAVMPHDAEIRRFEYGRGKVLIDAYHTEKSVEPRVGDVTLGGMRFVGYVSPREFSPSTSIFMERLVCTNGMTRQEEASLIRVRGNSVDEVIESMEQNARLLFDEVLPQRMHQWAETVNVTVDNAEQFVHRIARQTGLGSRMESRIIERIAGLPEDERSLYDITNVITAMQHGEGVSQRQRDLLQEVGGNIVVDEGHRCASCAQPID